MGDSKKSCSSHLFGCGKLGELEGLIKQYKAKKIFLVTGRSSYEKTGLKARLEKMFKDYETFRYCDFRPNPCPEDIIKGCEAARDFDPDIIVAAGGGSVMDTAKLISVLPADKEKIDKVIKGEIDVPERKIPLILIPTTAGTGSECTHFAVVYESKSKYSVASQCLLPDCSISDPELGAALPESVAAASAFDAFCQAVESYWAVGSTPRSRSYAAESISIFREYFLTFVKNRDRRSCEKMMLAAHLSGKAINISKTTGAHAVSYILSINYGIAHGYAVILTLPEFFVFNSAAGKNDLNGGLDLESHKSRMRELCALLGADDAVSAAERIRNFVKDAGMGIRLKDAGVSKKDDINMIAENVNIQRLKNNPVKINKKQLKNMLEKIY